MSRGWRIAAVGAAVLVFIAVSAVLARGFGAGGSEREAVIELVQAEAIGDARAVVRRIRGCARRPRCVRAVRVMVARLPHAPDPLIINVDPSTRLVTGGGESTRRVVWKVGNELPVVQCVRLLTEGDLIAGFDVHVLQLSPRIGLQEECEEEGG